MQNICQARLRATTTTIMMTMMMRFLWIAGVSIENAWAGVIMYLSYFVLFLKLFVDKYVYGKQVNMGIPGGGGKGAASKKAR